MKRLYLAAGLILVGIAGATFAQNVQNRLDPQNPADVTQASPAHYGATRHLQKQVRARMDAEYRHPGAGHQNGAMSHNKRPDID